jgi:hypothetical protein
MTLGALAVSLIMFARWSGLWPAPAVALPLFAHDTAPGSRKRA